MQQPAPRSKAARKSGVQAEGLRTWYKGQSRDLRIIEGATYLWFSQIAFAVEVHDEHIRWLHQLFLHAAGRNVNLVFMANAGSSTGTCDLAKFERQSCIFKILLLPVARLRGD
jgi:hypothetical protein